MRLICGIFNLNGAPVAESVVRNMLAQLTAPSLHPSADVYLSGPVGLGLLDFSCRPSKPCALERSGATVMAADVRLDDPAGLATTFGLEPTATDAALLSATATRFGDAGLAQTLGDFSFACWNEATQTLTCGRDSLGIRPFCYAYRPGEIFAFASLPKALYSTGIVPKQIDEDAVARHFARAVRPDDYFVPGIKRLPPAHVLEVSRECFSLRRYWQADRSAVGTSRASFAEASRELGKRIDTAVRCRITQTGEVGAHLSGGLDSSGIAVIAARRLRDTGRRLHAYSFVDRPRNDIQLEDESAYVKAVLAQEPDIESTLIQFSPQFDIDKPTEIHGMQPLSPDNPENAVSLRAQEQHVDLILSGWGGDEAASFNGRGGFAEMLLRGHWRTLAREVAAAKRERGVPWRSVFGEVIAFALPERLNALARRAIGRPTTTVLDRTRALSSSVRDKLPGSNDADIMIGLDGRENRWRLINASHLSRRAEIWAEIGARHGHAYAFPLLDRRVVEYALTLPTAFFLRDGFQRAPFREAMRRILPDEVRLRHDKFMPFPGVLLDIVDHRAELAEKLNALAANPKIAQMFDFRMLRTLLNDFPSAEDVRSDMQNGGNPRGIEKLLLVTQALATAAFIDRHGAQDSATDI